MFCPQCGAPNEDDAVFCGNCGAVLDADELDTEAGSETPQEVTAEEPLDEAPIEEAPEEEAPEEETPEEETPTEAEAGEEDAGEPAPVSDELPAVPPPPPPPPPTPRTGVQTSGMAIASLVSGVVGWTILPLLGSILAVVLGYAARKQIRQRPDELSGDGLAVAGLVLGWIAIGLSILGLCLGAIGLCFFVGILGASGY